VMNGYGAVAAKAVSPDYTAKDLSGVIEIISRDQQ
jgi:hypothetical protein